MTEPSLIEAQADRLGFPFWKLDECILKSKTARPSNTSLPAASDRLYRTVCAADRGGPAAMITVVAPTMVSPPLVIAVVMAVPLSTDANAPSRGLDSDLCRCGSCGDWYGHYHDAG